MIWFTADHHFGHKKINEFARRPFASIEEMDEIMIARWNEKVAATDQVYHLGDVGLCSAGKLRAILNKLNGKIYLIKGNHENSALECKERFEWIKDYYELIIEDQEAYQGKQLVVLFHYALRVWNASHWGSYHLYGHSHGTLPDDVTSRSFDIGVDCHNFYPLSYPEVKEILSKKQWKPPFGDR